MGLRLRVPLLEPGLRLRRPSDRTHQGIRPEVLAGKHDTPWYRWKGERLLTTFFTIFKSQSRNDRKVLFYRFRTALATSGLKSRFSFLCWLRKPHKHPLVIYWRIEVEQAHYWKPYIRAGPLNPSPGSFHSTEGFWLEVLSVGGLSRLVADFHKAETNMTFLFNESKLS